MYVDFHMFVRVAEQKQLRILQGQDVVVVCRERPHVRLWSIQEAF